MLDDKKDINRAVMVLFSSCDMKKTDLDVIRVETALSRFPMHRLAKAGTIEIVIRDQNDAGDVLRWKVSHNSEYGQPGPLAYKLDTLVINRRIDAVGRPTPKLVKLGSLREIAEATGTGEKNTTIVRRALYQNAGAFITAKVRYRGVDGTKRSIEFGTTRYAVVMTGETLPDGRRADAVYIILHDLYREVLDSALTRPLDYDYLRTLPPAPQRLYELLSFQMYASLKNGWPTARLTYSEFCLYAPQTRYFTYDQVKKQLYKLNSQHRASGYIAGVEYEATTDREGRADWAMIYTPGPRAKAEYRAFMQRVGGPVVIEAEPEPAPPPEPTGLERELIDRGVTPSQAAELVREFPEDRIRAQIGNLDGRRRKVKDAGAWLASAIRKGYAVKAGPVATRAEPVATPAVDRAGRDRAKAARSYWEGLTAVERERIDAEALAQVDPETRADYEAEARPVLRRMKLTAIRNAYLETLAVAG